MAQQAANAPTKFELPRACLHVRALCRRRSDEKQPSAIAHRRDDLSLRTASSGAARKTGTSFVHGLALSDSIMMRIRTSSIGLTTAATIAVVTVLMTGSAVAGAHIERFTKAEPQVPYRPSTAPVDRLLSAFDREQPTPLPAPVPRAAVTTLPAAIPKLPPVSATNPLEGKPLRYLIGTDMPGLGREGEITEVSYSTIKPTARGINVKYCNLFDEENTGRYGPYLHTSDTAMQYGEGQIDPAGSGWMRNLQDQYERATAQGFEFIELDNADAYHIMDVLGAVEAANGRGLKVIAKNPLLLEGDATSYIAHPNVFGVIVERGAGNPANMDALRRKAGRPNPPVWFVAFGDGRAWAGNVAKAAKPFSNMGVTYSSAGEYGNSIDLLRPNRAPS